MWKTSFFGILTVGNLHRKDLAWKKQLLQHRLDDGSCQIAVEKKNKTTKPQNKTTKSEKPIE